VALRFIDSAAHEGTGVLVPYRKWTLAAAGIVISGGRRNADYWSITGGGGLLKTLTHANCYIQGAAIQMVPGASSLGGAILGLYNNGTALVSCLMNADATISLAIGATNTGLSAIPVADPTSWHYYEMWGIVGQSGGNITGTATVVVDGNVILTGSGVCSISTSGLVSQSATANQVGVSNAGGKNFMDYYCLDTSTTDINGITGSTNTGFLGDVAIEALFPAADITTQWGTIGGDGTHAYSCVNEIAPDDDTSYVYTSSAGKTEAFTYQPIVGFNGTLLGAQYLACCRKDAEGSRVFSMQAGGTDCKTNEFLAVNQYLSDYYVYYIAPLDTLFGTAWTTSVYNTTTFQVELIS
jgi:hypothetical protein